MREKAAQVIERIVVLFRDAVTSTGYDVIDDDAISIILLQHKFDRIESVRNAVNLALSQVLFFPLSLSFSLSPFDSPIQN